MPNAGSTSGVPSTSELARRLVRRIEESDIQDPIERAQADELLASARSSNVNWPNLYQSACALFQRRDEVVRHVVRAAVLEATTDPESARSHAPPYRADLLNGAVSTSGSKPCQGFTIPGLTGPRAANWLVRPGLRLLARLIRDHPISDGGHAVVTTNFDPLISVALSQAGVTLKWPTSPRSKSPP